MVIRHVQSNGQIVPKESTSLVDLMVDMISVWFAPAVSWTGMLLAFIEAYIVIAVLKAVVKEGDFVDNLVQALF